MTGKKVVNFKCSLSHTCTSHEISCVWDWEVKCLKVETQLSFWHFTVTTAFNISPPWQFPHNACFHSVVVITFASHAKGPQFETGWKQLFKSLMKDKVFKARFLMCRFTVICKLQHNSFCCNYLVSVWWLKMRSFLHIFRSVTSCNFLFLDQKQCI